MRGRYTIPYRQDMQLLRTTSSKTFAVLTTVLAIALPFLLSSNVRLPLNFPSAEWLTAINFALIAVIGAAAFNLLLGYAHQISVAHAAFLMLGTTASAVFGTLWGWPFFVVLLVSGLLGAIVGIIVGLPALRLRGLYLLIATLGVHFIALFAYQSFTTSFFGFDAITFQPPSLTSWIDWLPFFGSGGRGGFVISGDFRWYWVLLPISAGSVLFMSNIVRTREGRALMAVRDHDVSAALIGINVTRSKLLVFAVSSAFVAMSGALGSYFIGARSGESFPFEVVLNYSIMAIVGGFTTMQGAVLGAFFFYLTPVLLKWAFVQMPGLRSIGFLRTYAEQTNLALFGILVIVILVVRPSGLTGMWQSTKNYFAQWPYSS